MPKRSNRAKRISDLASLLLDAEKEALDSAPKRSSNGTSADKAASSSLCACAAFGQASSHVVELAGPRPGGEAATAASAGAEPVVLALRGPQAQVKREPGPAQE